MCLMDMLFSLQLRRRGRPKERDALNEMNTRWTPLSACWNQCYREQGGRSHAALQSCPGGVLHLEQLHSVIQWLSARQCKNDRQSLEAVHSRIGFPPSFN